MLTKDSTFEEVTAILLKTGLESGNALSKSSCVLQELCILPKGIPGTYSEFELWSVPQAKSLPSSPRNHSGYCKRTDF